MLNFIKKILQPDYQDSYLPQMEIDYDLLARETAARLTTLQGSPRETPKASGKKYRKRLPKEHIAEIKWLAKYSDLAPETIAKRYGALTCTVSRIGRGATYKKVKCCCPAWYGQEVLKTVRSSESLYGTHI